MTDAYQAPAPEELEAAYAWADKLIDGIAAVEASDAATLLDRAVQRHIDTAHEDSANTYDVGEDMVVVHSIYWPNCDDEFEYHAMMRDAEAGEFDGRAICRECGGDLDDEEAAQDLEYHAACAGVED